MAGPLETPQSSSGHMPKKLIVCCDGTWRNSDSGIWNGTGLSWLWKGMTQVPTNATKISRAIQSVDHQGRQQIVYYQAGVGSAGNLVERVLGGALGIGLATNIREVYSFISNNYMPGDEIFLIGFSRGAFTARSVGGMICDLGLLNGEGQGRLTNIFEDWEHAGSEGYQTLLGKEMPGFSVKTAGDDPKAYVASYRKALENLGYVDAEAVPIKAMGVFDTVGSLGVPVNPLLQRLGLPRYLRDYRFYNTDLANNIENAFQALALDETRSAYRPALWQKLPGVSTNLKQTWFPGIHTNIGGGYPDSGLSNISLAWMMSNLEPFIDFNPEFIRMERDKHLRYLGNEKVPMIGLEWAASQLRESATGLRILLGTKSRKPGRYDKLDKRTSRILVGQPLQNTEERIHVAVRSRGVTGGLNERNEVTEYKPKALNDRDYELLDNNAEPGKASWRYSGKDSQFTGKILQEDQLGIFEKEAFEDFVSKDSS